MGTADMLAWICRKKRKEAQKEEQSVVDTCGEFPGTGVGIA